MPEQLQQTDVEKLVGELEIGVDRVRSLYEQYFMGIEKLEPLVPRKDVDRRIQLLRKEQIRNTALRFRFQMIVQRYNTYQTHWQRICREIENGTYKRHVARANKRFSTDAERRSSLPPPRRSSVPPRPEAGAETSPRPPSVAPPPKPAPMRTPPPPAAPAGFPQPGAAISAALAAELADLEADFGPLGGGAPVRPVAPASAVVADRKGPVPPALAAPAGSPVRPAAVARPGVPPPFAARPAVPQAPAARPIDAARAQVPTAPAQRPQPAPPPARPVASAAQPAAPTPAPAPRPPAASPAPRAPVAAPVPAAAPAARPPAASAADLSEQRVRALYQQYVDAKRRQNESTAAITYEGVAKSLRDSSAKLREKHGKSVDFEVAIRDGKTILKPVLK